MRRTRHYSERVSALGQAGVDLLRAEASVLRTELRLTSRTLLRALLLGVLAAFVAFWALAVVVFLGIEVGALWLPRWLAAAIVLLLLGVAVLVLTLVARRTLGRVETPNAIVRRRIDDHRDWWQARLARRPELGEREHGDGASD